MYKVFTNDKPVFIQEKPPGELVSKGTLILHYECASELGLIMDFADVDAVKKIVLWSENLSELWQQFQLHFTAIEAAGGLVLNSENKVLLIFRRGKWDLPKGKVDHEEIIQDAALREVKEECGLNSVEIEAPLEKTYHTYTMGDTHYLKTTHWFLMRASGNEPLIPQAEEDIEQAIWAGKAEALECIKNTYPNIALLLRHYFKV